MGHIYVSHIPTSLACHDQYVQVRWRKENSGVFCKRYRWRAFFHPSKIVQLYFSAFFCDTVGLALAVQKADQPTTESKLGNVNRAAINDAIHREIS